MISGRVLRLSYVLGLDEWLRDSSGTAEMEILLHHIVIANICRTLATE